MITAITFSANYRHALFVFALLGIVAVWYSPSMAGEASASSPNICEPGFTLNNIGSQAAVLPTWTKWRDNWCAEHSSGTYELNDVESVTYQRIDPIAGAIDDEYTLYTITFNDGSVHSVKVFGNMHRSDRDKRFRDIGYTGDVDDLIALAVEVDGPVAERTNDDDSRDIGGRASDGSSVTVMFKSGKKHTVSVGDVPLSDGVQRTIRTLLRKYDFVSDVEIKSAPSDGGAFRSLGTSESSSSSGGSGGSSSSSDATDVPGASYSVPTNHGNWYYVSGGSSDEGSSGGSWQFRAFGSGGSAD